MRSFRPARFTILNTVAILALILAPALPLPSPLGGIKADAGWLFHRNARRCQGAQVPRQSNLASASCQSVSKLYATVCTAPAATITPQSGCTPYGFPSPVQATQQAAVTTVAPIAAPVVPANMSPGSGPAPIPSPAVQPTPVNSTPSAAINVQGDGYNFGIWLNNERARRGLHALHHDATLAGYAASSSSQGFGRHHGPVTQYGTMPTGYPHVRRENLGVGSAGQVWNMWAASGSHASALFDPTATHYGIAHVGGVWTYNAR